MSDSIASLYPRLAKRLHKMTLADLPSPVARVEFEIPAGSRSITVKRDDISSSLYGGNKIRKLEYILQRAKEHGARRIATFGAVGSHHALATAIFAAQANLECTCFLAPQSRTPGIARTLNMHRRLGTEIVPISGSIDVLATLRQYLHGRRCWVVPMGGSSWLGAVGFVNAGLELAEQVASGELAMPDRIYMATGTMGSSAGLALGLALAGLPSELHAVRVVDTDYATPRRFDRLLRKTLLMLRRLDSTIPANAAESVRVRWRDEFFAGGYAVADDTTREAVQTAHDALGMALETTYTGKAMAALLQDLSSAEFQGGHCLFWNTYNSLPLPVSADRPDSRDNLPEAFMRYFD
ncbi:MAG: pyridoxal-phosphate dependent enzyme [Gammaproteobacteria bacterium]|nr:pyridoxal-phosphate dependent enzyme [Gammaproteobacteria bacterium]